MRFELRLPFRVVTVFETVTDHSVLLSKLGRGPRDSNRVTPCDVSCCFQDSCPPLSAVLCRTWRKAEDLNLYALFRNTSLANSFGYHFDSLP